VQDQMWDMNRIMYKILAGTPIERRNTVQGLRTHEFGYFKDRL